MKRAELGIHTNSAFARLLTDSVTVKIQTAAEPDSPRWRIAARHAAMVAYRQLQERLPDQNFSFFYAPSHPNYRAPEELPGVAGTAPVTDQRSKHIHTESESAAEDPNGEQISSQRAA